MFGWNTHSQLVPPGHVQVPQQGLLFNNNWQSDKLLNTPVGPLTSWQIHGACVHWHGSGLKVKHLSLVKEPQTAFIAKQTESKSSDKLTTFPALFVTPALDRLVIILLHEG